MAWVLQESKRGALGEAGQTGELQASSREVSPEREGVERQKPERGLMFEFTGLARLYAQGPVECWVGPRPYSSRSADKAESYAS